MAKLTKQYVKTAFAAKKTISEILSATRTTIEKFEEFIEKEFTGEYKDSIIRQITEYKESNSTNSIRVNSPEEEYTALEKKLEEKNKEAKSLTDKIEQKKKELNSLEVNLLTVSDEVNELTQKLKKLEKELTLHIVFSPESSDLIKSQYSEFNLKTLEEFDVEIDEKEIGTWLARIHLSIPKNMEFANVIRLVKTIIFIRLNITKHKKIRLYVPEDIKGIFYEYSGLDITEINVG